MGRPRDTSAPHPARTRARISAAPLLLAGLGLALSACGADSTGTTAPTTGGDAAGACLSGSENCQDFPTGSGGVTSGPDGSVTVSDAVSSGIDGPFLMSGYWVSDAGGDQLCATLAESFPPQCGLPAIAVQADTTQVPDGLTREGDVTWSEEPVSIEGEIVDGVFVVGSP